MLHMQLFLDTNFADVIKNVFDIAKCDMFILCQPPYSSQMSGPMLVLMHCKVVQVKKHRTDIYPLHTSALTGHYIRLNHHSVRSEQPHLP